MEARKYWGYRAQWILMFGWGGGIRDSVYYLDGAEWSHRYNMEVEGDIGPIYIGVDMSPAMWGHMYMSPETYRNRDQESQVGMKFWILDPEIFYFYHVNLDSGPIRIQFLDPGS